MALLTSLAHPAVKTLGGRQTISLQFTRSGARVWRVASEISRIPTLADAGELQGRVAMSSGTETAAKQGHANYTPNAVIPRPPWRPMQITASCDAAFWPSMLALVKIPYDLIAPLYAAAREGHGDITTSWPHGIAQRIGQLFADDGLVIHAKGPFFGQPDQSTTTLDRPNGKKIGLHIDSWFKQNSVFERNRSPGRICINAGTVSRFFLFLDITLPQIIQTLILDGLDIPYEYANASHIAKIFLRRFPEWPVIKVEIRPGEAYVAATETLIHDASSQGVSENDVSFVVFAYVSKFLRGGNW